MTRSPDSTEIAAHERAHTYIQAFLDAGITDPQRISDLAWASEAYLAGRQSEPPSSPPPDGLRTPAEPTRKPSKPTLASVAKQAGKAGIDVARYEVKPDGSITIVTGKPEPAAMENPWSLDEFRTKETKQ